jgi:hypothetical protein
MSDVLSSEDTMSEQCELKMQEEEADESMVMSLEELKARILEMSQDLKPDTCHAIQLYYFQQREDMQVEWSLLRGFSSGDLYCYQLRPKPKVIFLIAMFASPLTIGRWQTSSPPELRSGASQRWGCQVDKKINCTKMMEQFYVGFWPKGTMITIQKQSIHFSRGSMISQSTNSSNLTRS